MSPVGTTGKVEQNQNGRARMDADLTVDARGTRCPRPVIELSRALDDRTARVVVLLADDPNARVDVPVWCRLQQHELVEISEHDGAWRFVVRSR